MKNTTARKPATWQTEAARITTDLVQFWARGSFVKISKADAAAMVTTGEAFVVSAQVIGLLVNGKMEA